MPPLVRAIDAKVAPKRVVLLPALDRDTESRPYDMRLKAGTLGKLPPPALLIDERLSDVEKTARSIKCVRWIPLQCLALQGADGEPMCPQAP